MSAAVDEGILIMGLVSVAVFGVKYGEGEDLEQGVLRTTFYDGDKDSEGFVGVSFKEDWVGWMKTEGLREEFAMVKISIKVLL